MPNVSTSKQPWSPGSMAGAAPRLSSENSRSWVASQPVPDTRKQHCSVATKPEMVVSAQLLELRHRQGGQPGADVRPKGTLKLDSTGRIIVWDVVGATAADVVAAVGGNAGSWSGRHSTKPATASSRE